MMKQNQLFWTNSLSEYQFSQVQIEFFNIYPEELLCMYTAKHSNKFQQLAAQYVRDIIIILLYRYSLVISAFHVKFEERHCGFEDCG